MSKHTKPTYKIPTNMRKCRLRTGLNDDCLRMIFQRLDPKDLMEVSSMDVHLENLIGESVVPKIWIFLQYFVHNRSSFFKKFGSRVRKLNISSARGTNDKFKEKYTGMKNKVSHLKLQFLSNLRELHMTIQTKNDVFMFKQLSVVAPNLKYLHLNIYTHAIFLENEFPNLIKLHINHRWLHKDLIQSWEINVDEELIENHIKSFVEKKLFLKEYEYNKEICKNICSIM